MDIIKELKTVLPANRIKSRYIDVISYASDAGFYHLIPKAVVHLVNDDEVVKIFKFSQKNRIPLVFRTGGTSLSGQSITDGILVDLSQYWNKIHVEDNGNSVRVQPGVTGAMVNAYLKNYKRKIGPDPSSINAAMMGGILSNNSSGMCCGVKLNSYHTIKSIKFVLPNGEIYNTECIEDYLRFQQENETLFNGLLNLKYRITSNKRLNDKIRHKYLTKNTVGYSLNAFIDYEHPLDIIAHLLIGAEGSLAFISEAVMSTVPNYEHKATSLLYFPTIFEACNAIMAIKESGALMIELMDRASLYAIENMEGVPDKVGTLPKSAAALLIEYQENDESELNNRVAKFLEQSNSFNLIEPPIFTKKAIERDLLWRVRKGLFPAVGAVRKSGTTVILEDIAFPVDTLGRAILELQDLFVKHHYSNAIIFGHAKDGNLHFVLTQAFNSKKEVNRYGAFIQDVVDLVVNKYEGTLKAEHGTGRNMAPFVVTEWGEEAYGIMKKVKSLIDPNLLLNPGVIINDDAEIHLKNLKELPTVEQEVDKCIECGYCEPKCPSRNVTMSPRRRITARRELKKLEENGDTNNYKRLKKQFQYDGLDSCAVDGLCATACPVGINTGDLVKRLRRENHSSFSHKIALIAANNFKVIEKTFWFVLKFGNVINKVFGKTTMFRLTKGLKKAIPAIPIWSKQIVDPPNPSKIVKLGDIAISSSKTNIVYFPSCISRILGSYEGKQQNIMETFLSVCKKADIGVVIIDKLNGSCCSQIFSSKGFNKAASFTANSIVSKLWHDSKQGLLPIVIDVSSCAYTLHNLERSLNTENIEKYKQLHIMDSVDFLSDMVLPLVRVKHKKKDIVLHPVCSLEKMKTQDKFEKIARYFAENVIIPNKVGCCGMAGDRGFLFPELTTSATKLEALEVSEQRYNGYYSSTRTCEMAMSESVNENYESILFLVEEGIM